MASTGKRILVFGADGLRPDLFEPGLMPNAALLVQSGTWLGDHHAAYPSHTRVNASTLATGTSPGRHGIVANTMLVPGATDDHIVDTSQYQHLDALARSNGGQAQLVPSLADILMARGERVAVAGTGSSGSNALWTFNDRGRIVNPNSTFGIADLYDLREKLGPAPGSSDPTATRLHYATRAVTELYLGDPVNRVIVLWLAEPDSALHRFGLGSPESRNAMAAVDDCLGLILEAMEAQGRRDQFDIVFLSDHGHSTVRAHKSLREFLADARKDLGGHLPDLATASDFVYATPGTAEPTVEQLAPLVQWLDAQPWVDVIAGGTSGLAALPGVIPLRDLWNGQVNPRRPLLAVSPAWSDATNEFGVPGTVTALTTQGALRSSHGSLSPYDMHATFFANGPSFREGWRSEIPTGAIDLMPTILHLLGIEAPAGLDGRVVREALAGAGGDMPEVRKRTLEPLQPGRVGRGVTLHDVNGTQYVHGSMPGAGGPVRG